MNGDIVNAEAFLLAMELPEPFPLGFGTLASLPRILLRLTAESGDGAITGIGEASIDFPLSAYDAWDIYFSLIHAPLCGLNIENRSSLLRDPGLRDMFRFAPAAFAAVNMALDDLAGRFMRRSVISFYNPCRTEGQALVGLSFKRDKDELREAMAPLVKQGVPVKLKGGQGVDIDAPLLAFASGFISAARQSFTLDFNASYTLTQFKSLVQKLNLHGFAWSSALFIEQPTTVEEGIDGLVAAREHLESLGINTPIMADESFITAQDAVRCSRRGILLNFKIHKIGGGVIAQEIEDAVSDSRLPSIIGGTFPTAIGRAYDQQMGCTLRSATLPSDGWMPSTWFSGEKHLITESFKELGGGWHAPLEGNGLGITLNWSRIQKYVVENPKDEYTRIRNNRDCKYLKIALRGHETYSRAYARITGRQPDWNL